MPGASSSLRPASSPGPATASSTSSPLRRRTATCTEHSVIAAPPLRHRRGDQRVHTAGTGLQRPPGNQPGRRTAPDPPEVTPSQHRPYSGFDSCHVQLPAVSLEQHLTDAPAAMARLVHDLDVEHVADEPDSVAHVAVHRRTAGHELEDARALAVVLADDLGDAWAGPGAATK